MFVSCCLVDTLIWLPALLVYKVFFNPSLLFSLITLFMTIVGTGIRAPIGIAVHIWLLASADDGFNLAVLEIPQNLHRSWILPWNSRYFGAPGGQFWGLQMPKTLHWKPVKEPCSITNNKNNNEYDKCMIPHAY